MASALPAQVPVKARIGRDQRALKGRKGIQHMCRRGVAAIDRDEGLPVGLIRAKLGKQLLPVLVHEMRVEQHRLVLFLERTEIASPVEAEVERHVENGRSVEVEKLAVQTRGAGPVVIPALGQQVAGGAGQHVAARETDVVEQHLTQPHLVGIQGDAERNGRDRLLAKRDRRAVPGADARLRMERDRRYEERTHGGHHPPWDRGSPGLADGPAFAQQLQPHPLEIGPARPSFKGSSRVR